MDDSVLMICDAEKAIGIAGIMGGENSMITENVHTMLLRRHVLMEQISVNLPRRSVSVPMLLLSLKKDWIQTLPWKR